MLTTESALAEVDFLNCVRECIDPPCTPGTQAGGETAEASRNPQPQYLLFWPRSHYHRCLPFSAHRIQRYPPSGRSRLNQTLFSLKEGLISCSCCLPLLIVSLWVSDGCICSVAPKADLEPQNQEIPAHLAVRTPASSVQEETHNWCEMRQSSVSKETLILLKLISVTLQKVMLKYLICVTFLFPRGLWEGNKDPHCVFLMLLVMVLVNMCSINS